MTENLDLTPLRNAIASLREGAAVLADAAWFTAQAAAVQNTLMAGVIQNFEFELGKKTIENFELSTKMDQIEELKKIFEIQHEENLKMLKNSYENEIFFLNNQLSKCQNQLLKLTKNQKKFQHQQIHHFDIETQIDFENKKAKFEIEKKNYEITLKNYQNIIEILSLRLKKSDGDVEVLMQENCEIKTNYEKLKNSAESLKKNFDEKNTLFDKLMVS